MKVAAPRPTGGKQRDNVICCFSLHSWMSILFQPQPFSLSLSACSLLKLPRASFRKLACPRQVARTTLRASRSGFVVSFPPTSPGTNSIYSLFSFPPSSPPSIDRSRRLAHHAVAFVVGFLRPCRHLFG